MRLLKKTHGIYATSEMGWMMAFQKARGRLFLPLARLATHAGMTPLMVSTLSGLAAIFGLIFSIIWKRPEFFIGSIWLHFFLDGFDGTLARYQGKTGLFGIFIDVIFDHIGILATSFFLIWFEYAPMGWTILFLFSYTVVICASLFLGAVGHPYTFIFRPRMFVFLSLTSDIFWHTKISAPLVMWCALLLGVTGAWGVWRIAVYCRKNPFSL